MKIALVYSLFTWQIKRKGSIIILNTKCCSCIILYKGLIRGSGRISAGCHLAFLLALSYIRDCSFINYLIWNRSMPHCLNELRRKFTRGDRWLIVPRGFFFAFIFSLRFRIHLNGTAWLVAILNTKKSAWTAFGWRSRCGSGGLPFGILFSGRYGWFQSC